MHSYWEHPVSPCRFSHCFSRDTPLQPIPVGCCHLVCVVSLSVGVCGSLLMEIGCHNPCEVKRYENGPNNTSFCVCSQDIPCSPRSTFRHPTGLVCVCVIHSLLHPFTNLSVLFLLCLFTCMFTASARLFRNNQSCCCSHDILDSHTLLVALAP